MYLAVLLAADLEPCVLPDFVGARLEAEVVDFESGRPEADVHVAARGLAADLAEAHTAGMAVE